MTKNRDDSSDEEIDDINNNENHDNSDDESNNKSNDNSDDNSNKNNKDKKNKDENLKISFSVKNPKRKNDSKLTGDERKNKRKKRFDEDLKLFEKKLLDLEREEKKKKENEKKRVNQRKRENQKKDNRKKNPPVIMFDLIDLIGNDRFGNIINESPPQNNYHECYYDYEGGPAYTPSPPPPPPPPLPIKYLDIELKSIDDFIIIAENFRRGDYSDDFRYNINLQKVNNLLEPLIKLRSLIGMENVKKDVFDLLLYQLQDFDNSKDMLHTIIEGEPGVRKTELAKILGKIYKAMGYCHNDIIKFVKRSDLIGGYLGQTAIKTQKVLDECKGGILIIDEAYSLGNPEGRDSYSKECIDTLTAFLSESPDTIVFIMGYKEALQECLFAHNKGLERRFTYRFSINKYKPDDLRLILFKVIREQGWDIEDEEKIPVNFFDKNMGYFKFNGGDMLNLFTKCKFTHSIRFFNINRKSDDNHNFENLKKKINYEDIKNAFKLLLKDENFKKRTENDLGKTNTMYL